MSPELELAYEVARELARARTLHGPQHGPHEGYAVILEELDELWDEVKKKRPDPAAMRKECIQIAAMAMRFVLDVCDKQTELPSDTIDCALCGKAHGFHVCVKP